MKYFPGGCFFAPVYGKLQRRERRPPSEVHRMQGKFPDCGEKLALLILLAQGLDIGGNAAEEGSEDGGHMWGISGLRCRCVASGRGRKRPVLNERGNP